MSSGAIKEKIESYSYGTGDATLAGAQTFSGAKTFSAGITNAASYGPHTTGYVIMGASNDTLAITSNGAHNTHISTNSNTNSGNILIQQGANNPISITPNGTGDIQLNADTIRVGDNNADATITTRGTGDLTLSTNEGTNAGTILLADGANGDISITPNGTGQVKLGGDLDTNSHNIVIDDAHGILDENSNEQLIFQTTANATSYLQVWNGISDSATGTLFGNDVISTDTVGTGRMTGPGLEATGSTTDVGMSFKTKGLGHFVFTNDDATSAAGPVINLLRNNLEGEVADDDIIGLIKFMGADTVMTEEGSLQSLHDYRDYAKIECNIVDQTNTTADGNLILSAMCADSHTDFLEIGTNKTNDTSAGVRAYTGSMVTYSGTGTTALSRDTHAGAYVRATGAGTFTLWDNPKVGDQVVVISDHAGTTTIDGYSSDTINGSANTTITTQYNAKTFIATSTTTWVALG
jgi:hypothetical protein